VAYTFFCFLGFIICVPFLPFGLKLIVYMNVQALLRYWKVQVVVVRCCVTVLYVYI